MADTIKIIVLWDVMPRSLIDRNKTTRRHIPEDSNLQIEKKKYPYMANKMENCFPVQFIQLQKLSNGIQCIGLYNVQKNAFFQLSCG
jgi:hypothetical protein